MLNVITRRCALRGSAGGAAVVVSMSLLGAGAGLSAVVELVQAESRSAAVTNNVAATRLERPFRLTPTS
jgi:hypothetical protein